MQIEGENEVQISGGGLPMEHRVWMYRFRPGSQPRVQSFGGVARDDGSVDVDVEFSEPLFAAGTSAISAALDGGECTSLPAEGESAPSMSFVCASGAGEALTLSIAADVAAPGGGVLTAREIHTPLGEVYRDPI
ncbi:MAG: hypothetical protein M3Y87_34100 [Myxococcota bacterium]|nr:hypothetical protein [Myxococcota bacterium]